MIDPELRDAVHELHEYLADRLAPLMVADAMELLLQQPPALLAHEISHWAAQHQEVASASDLLFHCVKKISLMGEFDLVPRERLAVFLRELCEGVLVAAPAEERSGLRQSLDRLQQGSVPVSATPVEMLHRPAPAASVAATPAVEPELSARAMTAGIRRLGLLLARLRPSGASALANEQRSQVLSQMLAAAAAEAHDDAELERHLRPLRQLGVGSDSEAALRTLSQTMAGWGPLPQGAAGTANELTAMRRIVSLTRDAATAGKRFRELVQAAVEQFNQGQLGRAAQMIELAEGLAREQKVHDIYVEPVRRGHASLDPDRLRQSAERADSRASLRTVLSFFKALRPEGLLASLDGEPNRDRRRQLLALLEVHGAPARAEAFSLLQAWLEGRKQVDTFFPMNLVYLLRVIPRPEDAPIENEIELVTKAPGPSSPLPLVKQVVSYLGHTRHERAERALLTFLQVFESMLLRPESTGTSPPEVEILLDRTCAALSRIGSPRAWKALLDHGLSADARLGSRLERLAEAARGQDLASNPEIVSRLLSAIDAELPKGVLGSMRRDDARLRCLLRAVSGTSTPAVSMVLEDLASRFEGQRIGAEAARALGSVRAAVAPAEPPAGLSGSLDLFGLPDVLQTLSGSGVTGVLTLINSGGLAEATILLEGGAFRGGRFRAIEGPEAVYQAFERPFRGTFAFVARGLAGDASRPGQREPLPQLAEPRPVIDLILEGVRRHDEWKRAAAVVPDDAALAPTGQTWSGLPDENPDFAVQVWEAVVAGTTPVACDSEWATDSYRIRRLLAHWVEEGALRVVHA